MLGQNVNSYWDQEALSSTGWIESRERRRIEVEQQQHARSEGGDRGRDEEEAMTLTGAVTGAVAVEPYAYSIASGFSQRTRVQSRGAQKSSLEAKENKSILENGLEGEGEGGERGEEGEVEWQGEGGVRFAELLSLVAAIDPDNMRIRFQSPHPKDFPNEVGR